ncbi:MAG: PaaI family thioesterase [Leptospiraceae bacterium]|nr:PaaI family thioesterase [Leptospiraceae bacterium]MCP5485974.1 PaaI family thioesterase [Spirochaetales bacterium]
MSDSAFPDLSRIVDASLYTFPPRGGDFLDTLQQLIDQCLPGTIGLKLLSMKPEVCRASLDYHVKTAGLHGLMHGGTIFAAGDTLTALMLLFHMSEHTRNVLTSGARIRYLRPVPRNTTVELEARLLDRTADRFKTVCDFFDSARKRVARANYDYILVDRAEFRT